jgi:hypothetical protein
MPSPPPASTKGEYTPSRRVATLVRPRPRLAGLTFCTTGQLSPEFGQGSKQKRRRRSFQQKIRRRPRLTDPISARQDARPLFRTLPTLYSAADADNISVKSSANINKKWSKCNNFFARRNFFPGDFSSRKFFFRKTPHIACIRHRCSLKRAVFQPPNSVIINREDIDLLKSPYRS